jgi:transposase
MYFGGRFGKNRPPVAGDGSSGDCLVSTRYRGKLACGAARPSSRAGQVLRDALYMPALVAARFNSDLKPNCQRLVKAGKPHKVAITAIMRKFIERANAILRDNRTWTPNNA